MTDSRQLTSMRGSSAILRAASARSSRSCKSAVILERIARRHQPPHAVELQPLDREQADGAMRDMRRIERAAEQADAHAVGVERDGLARRTDNAT